MALYCIYIQLQFAAMHIPTPDNPNAVSLEQLLHREDIWRGHSQRFTARTAVPTGYEALNAGLLNRGWPLSTLIEVCQNGYQAECQLMFPALASLGTGLIMLLNPPTTPFAHALVQAGIDLDRLVIVDAATKVNFLRCFTELSRAGTCDAVLAWQPHDHLTYTELRKCLLAAADGAGLYVMFRPSANQQLNSPAPLRLFSQLTPQGLELTIYKQKGLLQKQQPRPIVLPVPEMWLGALPHHVLDQQETSADVERLPRLATVSPFRGKP